MLIAVGAACGEGSLSLHPRSSATAKVDAGPPDAEAPLDRRALPVREEAPFVERTLDHFSAPRAPVDQPAPWLGLEEVPGEEPRAGCDAAEYFARVRLLQEQLALTVGEVRRRRVGVAVVDEEGRMLFAHNARLSFSPASNVKLITAGAALSGLGPRHRFVTEVRGAIDSDGAVGPLFLRGSGDPSLVTEHLIELARQLVGAGLVRLRGPLVLDVAQTASPTDPPGYRRFRSTNPYRAGVGALSLNDNVIRVSVQPTQPGSPAMVTLYPPSAYLVPRVRVRTSRWGTRLSVKTARQGDRTRVHVSGRVARRHGLKRFWRRVFDPARYTARTFLAVLRAEGVQVAPRVRLVIGRAPARVPRIALHRSAPLGEILWSMLKHSNNFKAESLLLATGAARFGGPASYPKARRALAEFLAAAGVEPGTYRLPNGSGLARRARFKPVAMVKVLIALHRDFSLGPDLLAALPLAGVDGTLRRRLRGAEVVGFVRAKTGTLAGVTCLSGYAGYGGRVLYFSVMAWRAGSSWRVLRLQRKITRALVGYLRQS